MSILDVFCSVDEFWQTFAPGWEAQQLTSGGHRRGRPAQLHPSEIMTILIWFHGSHYRTVKAYYLEYVQTHLRGEFPTLVSYQRFVELMPAVVVPLLAYLQQQMGECTGISFIDSPSLSVCHPARIRQHRVFAATAKRGKTSVGWFYGFKRHLVVNDRGELLSFCLTPGNVDDRQPVPQLARPARRLFGKRFGDKGYISHALTEQLIVDHRVHLVTRLRKKMRNRLMEISDQPLLRKRAIIESIYDQLKNICQVEHSRHRRPANFLINLLGGLIAYCHLPKKPSLDLGPLALPAA
jgi:hypothetical protein